MSQSSSKCCSLSKHKKSSGINLIVPSIVMWLNKNCSREMLKNDRKHHLEEFIWGELWVLSWNLSADDHQRVIKMLFSYCCEALVLSIFCFIRMPKKKDMTIFVLVHAGTRWQGSVFVPLTQQYCVSRTNVCLSIICHCQEDLCCLVNQVEQTRETLMDYAEEILTKFWVHEVKGHAGTDTRLDRHSSTFSLTSKFPQC